MREVLLRKLPGMFCAEGGCSEKEVAYELFFGEAGFKKAVYEILEMLRIFKRSRGSRLSIDGVVGINTQHLRRVRPRFV